MMIFINFAKNKEEKQKDPNRNAKLKRCRFYSLI